MKTLEISQPLLNNENKHFTDFVLGFISNLHWTTVDEGTVILRQIYDNVHSSNKYIVTLSTVNDKTSWLFENDNIRVKIACDVDCSLYDLFSTKIKTKNIQAVCKRINDKNLSDFELGKFIGVIISDAVIEDEYRNKVKQHGDD